MGLELLLAGALASNPLDLSLASSTSFSSLYMQNQIRRESHDLYNQYRRGQIAASPILEKKIKELEREKYIRGGKDPEQIDKEIELHLKTFTAMNDAKKHEGHPITGWNPSTFIKGKEVHLHIHPEYHCGPRGGNDELRIKIYLGEEAWYEPIAIGDLTLSLYSFKETKLSKKVHELNVNYSRSRVVHMPLDERMLEANVLNKRMKKAFYTAIKKSTKITKQNIDDYNFLVETIKDLEDYKRREELIEGGNLMLGRLVYLEEIFYNGYGFIDPISNVTGKLLRAPKFVEIWIKRGENSIKGINLKTTLRYYTKNYLRTADLKNEKVIECRAPFNMEDFAETIKDRLPYKSEKESEENKDNKESEDEKSGDDEEKEED